MDDNTNYCALLSKQSNCHRVGKKDFTNVLDRNASVSIHQELDYTVNVFCKKSTFGTVWDILKKIILVWLVQSLAAVFSAFS